MNLIETIAGHIAAGLSAAASAARLAAEHGLEVSEDWVRKIMSADGFSSAVASAQTKVGAVAEDLSSVAEAADSEVKTVEADAEKVVDEAKALPSAAGAAIAEAEAKALGEVPKVTGGGETTGASPAVEATAPQTVPSPAPGPIEGA